MENPFVFEIEQDFESTETPESFDYTGGSGASQREATEEEVQYSIIISPTSPGDSRYRLPGSDTTTPSSKKYPWNTVCMIEVERNGKFVAAGTGALIAPQVVLTAKHVLEVSAGKPEAKLRITPGADLSAASQANRMPASPNQIVVAANRIKFHSTLDYGVAILPQKFTKPNKFMLLHPRRPFQPADFLNVAGYPCDKATGTMWAHSEPVLVKGVNGSLIRYTMDTCPGHSGSPVWVRRPDGQRAQVAVHVQGVSGPDARCKNNPGKTKCVATPPGSPAVAVSGTNTGVFITCDVVKTIMQWCAQFGVQKPGTDASFQKC